MAVVVVEQCADQLPEAERVVGVAAGEVIVIAGAEVRLAVEGQPGQERGGIERSPKQTNASPIPMPVAARRSGPRPT